jgi:uncharacterized protein (UPF0335 family)
MSKTIWEMGKKEQLDPAEAGERFLAFVREVKELDQQNETVNRRKAALFKDAKGFGFTSAALKEIARPTYPDQVDTDEKALRQYIRLTAGDDAAKTMKNASQFGAILFGDAEAWPADKMDCD